jgi:hypothetical protein
MHDFSKLLAVAPDGRSWEVDNTHEAIKSAVGGSFILDFVPLGHEGGLGFFGDDEGLFAQPPVVNTVASMLSGQTVCGTVVFCSVGSHGETIPATPTDIIMVLGLAGSWHNATHQWAIVNLPTVDIDASERDHGSPIRVFSTADEAERFLAGDWTVGS